MTTQEALDRALEALRDIVQLTIADENGDSVENVADEARGAIHEIQRGLWIEEVVRPPEIHMALRISREVFRELWGYEP